ncbi:MAG: insulinase family protein [Desulfuromonadales bacterium]|nr:insulinase family protein [Desulfuromonadales bacterium]
MSHLFSRLALLLVLLFLAAPAVQAQKLEEKVATHLLKNGLKLLLVERPESPTVAAYITIGVGSVHETSQNRGVAHLLEHMLFKGTETIGTRDFRQEKPLLEEIEKVGSRLDRLKNQPGADPQEIAALQQQLDRLQAKHGELVIKDEFSRIYAEHGGAGFNAFTSKDLTTYLVSLPANKLELWAAVESDRMQSAVLREFYTEREVVMEERRRSYETSPRGLLYENLLATAFTMHPYRNPIIGWMSDLENLTLEETRDFFQRYYAPVNTVIALVGDIDTPAAIAMVERYFGNIPAGTPVPPVVAVEPPQVAEKRIHVRFDAEPQLSIAFHKPTLPAKEDYVFDLIDLILGQGRTSRLYRALVVEKGLATSVSTSSAPGSRFPNLFVISAVPRFPHTPQEVEAAIYEELERLIREPVQPEELEQVRTRLRTDRLRFLRGNDGLARMLTYYETIAGDWRYVVTYDEQVAALTAADVQDVARRFFTPTNRTVAILTRGDN